MASTSSRVPNPDGKLVQVFDSDEESEVMVVRGLLRRRSHLRSFFNRQVRVLSDHRHHHAHHHLQPPDFLAFLGKFACSLRSFDLLPDVHSPRNES